MHRSAGAAEVAEDSDNLQGGGGGGVRGEEREGVCEG